MTKATNKILILLILLVFNVNYSQDWDSIVKSDKVYIFFNHGEYQKVKEPDINNIKLFDEIKNYEIRFNEENYINFSDRKYLDYDNAVLKKEMERKYVRKNFLNKNKDIIIDINFIKKNGLEKVYFLILYKKKYIIDVMEFKRNKILIKETTFGFVSYSSEE